MNTGERVDKVEQLVKVMLDKNENSVGVDELEKNNGDLGKYSASIGGRLSRV